MLNITVKETSAYKSHSCPKQLLQRGTLTVVAGEEKTPLVKAQDIWLLEVILDSQKLLAKFHWFQQDGILATFDGEEMNFTGWQII